MKTINKKILFGLLLTASCFEADAINITTQKKQNEDITIAVDRGLEIIIQWENGEQTQYISDGLPHQVKLQSSTFELITQGELTSLFLPDNQITNIILNSESRNLEQLLCPNNLLKNLNLTECKKLKVLDCQGNNLSSIEIDCPELIVCNIADNEMTSLELEREATQLQTLSISNNKYQTLSIINKCPQLRTLFAAKNQLNEINLKQHSLLQILDLEGNNIQKLHELNSPELKHLLVTGNQIDSLDLSSCYKLRSLYASDNQLHSITWNKQCSSSFQRIDVANNHLYYNSFPSVYDVIRKKYTITCRLAPQSPWLLADETKTGVAKTEWRKYFATNGWGKAILTDVSLSDQNNDILLEDADYTFKGKVFTFNTPQNGVVITSTSKNYPNVCLKTQSFNIIQNTTDIETINKHNKNIKVSAGVAYVTLDKKTPINIFTLDGKHVLQTLQETGTSAYYLPKGLYLINNTKVFIP